MLVMTDDGQTDRQTGGFLITADETSQKLKDSGFHKRPMLVAVGLMLLLHSTTFKTNRQCPLKKLRGEPSGGRIVPDTNEKFCGRIDHVAKRPWGESSMGRITQLVLVFGGETSGAKRSGQNVWKPLIQACTVCGAWDKMGFVPSKELHGH
jgi:hypothetical protein